MLTTDSFSYDMQNVWKGQLTDMVKQMQNEQAAAMDKLKMEYEGKYNLQVS